MISYGKNIVSKEDKLTQISLQNLYEHIRKPEGDVLSLISHLRLVRTLDLKQYSEIKKRLPYVVCGIFNPAFRRTENFGYIEYFVLDLDHLSSKEIMVNALQCRLINDMRVVMCFKSPGEDGLKVLMKLSEKCYDPGQFSIFYKAFVLDFAKGHGIEQVVDNRTSDVTRACFLSYDPDVYFNPNAQPVSMSDFIDFDNPFEVMEEKNSVEERIKAISAPPELPSHDELTSDAISNIKKILKLSKAKEQNIKSICVPEELDEIIDSLKAFVESTGVIVTDISNISYGKKISVKTDLKRGEVNLFYGKRGFHPVATPKRGTDSEFNSLIVELIQCFVNNNYQL